MGRAFEAFREVLSWLASLATVVALAALLHSRFRDHDLSWEGIVLVWAVSAWWLCTPPLQDIDDLRTTGGQRRGQGIAIALFVLAWAARGSTVVAAVALSSRGHRSHRDSTSRWLFWPPR